MRPSAFLLVLAVGGVAIAAPSVALPEGRKAGAPAAVPTAAAKAVVYYFHATTRCATCRTIEAYAHETVARVFAPDLQSGSLEWKAVNVDEPANRHFIGDFQLYTRSVVVVDAKNPKRYKVLDQVWQLVRNKGAFQKYIEQEVRAFRRS